MKLHQKNETTSKRSEIGMKLHQKNEITSKGTKPHQKRNETTFFYGSRTDSLEPTLLEPTVPLELLGSTQKSNWHSALELTLSPSLPIGYFPKGSSIKLE